MEVKAGYKQTEVGIIPKDWVVKKLGEIAPISTGNTPPTNDPKNYGDEFLFVSPVDLGTERYISHTEKMLSQKGFSISRPFPKGSILFVCIGSTIGKCGIASKTLTSNQQINAVFPSTGTSFDFLYYALVAVAPKVKSLAGEQAVPIVNKTQFSETLLALPTLTEQEAVAEALGDADILIEALEQLIAKKRQVKQGAMQELLTGKRRLPGFSKKTGYKSTEAGVIPEDWDAPTLGELFVFKNGLNKAKSYFGYGTPIVNYMDVYGNRGLLADGIKGRVSLSKEEIRTYEVRRGDVFFTRTSETVEEVGITSVMLDLPKDTVFSGFVLRARPIDNSLDDHYKKYCFSTYFARKQITSQSTETTRALTNGRHLSRVKIARPSLPEQTAIAEILSDMDAEIAALEAKLSKAREVKAGMMQELLTGRVRLV